MWKQWSHLGSLECSVSLRVLGLPWPLQGDKVRLLLPGPVLTLGALLRLARCICGVAHTVIIPSCPGCACWAGSSPEKGAGRVAEPHSHL